MVSPDPLVNTRWGDAIDRAQLQAYAARPTGWVVEAADERVGFVRRVATACIFPLLVTTFHDLRLTPHLP